ncbi:MAG: hypothetical protein KKB59_18245, partial [Spirochaetes bacterium]|nr:hypothetical protein [Spirochaetota bacterium]
MIVNLLRLRGATGIMSGLGLEEIELDFRNMPAGVAVLCGVNGAGKTTVLENLIPYPSLLSRDGSLYDSFYLPNSERFLQAQIGGVDYTFLLVINPAKRTTEAYAWRGDKSLTDGRLTQYGQVLNDLLGDFDAFRRSVFSDQSGESFLTLPRSGRKDFLTRLIGGLDCYQDYCERAKGFSTAATRRITELTAQVELLRGQSEAGEAAEKVAFCTAALERLGAAKAEAEAGLQNVNEKLTGLRDIMQAEAQNAQARKRLMDQMAAIEKEQIAVDQQHVRLIAELTAKPQQLKSQLDQLSVLLQEKESLEAKLSALKSKQAIYQQHKVSAERLRGLRTEEALLNSKIATTQEALNRYKVVVPCNDGLYTNCPLWQGAQRGKPSAESLQEAERKRAEITKLISELQQSLTQMQEPESFDPAIQGVQDKLNTIAGSKATIAQLNERLNDVKLQQTRAEQEYQERKASLRLSLAQSNNTLQ